MSDTNVVTRTVHDLSLATWFGGSLMGAVGLGAAAREAGADGTEVEKAGWDRWTPIYATAIAGYLASGAALTFQNKGRLVHQQGVGTAVMVKNVLTVTALAATVATRVLGGRVGRASASSDPSNGSSSGSSSDPSSATSSDTSSDTRSGASADATSSDGSASRRWLRVAQVAVPLQVGALIAVTSVLGEQQRPRSVLRGVTRRFLPGR